jgi:hypothetical protein
MTHMNPYSRHHMSFTLDSSTHTPSHVIKTRLVALNAHNVYIHKPLNNITSLAAWKNLQDNGAFVSIESKIK